MERAKRIRCELLGGTTGAIVPPQNAALLSAVTPLVRGAP